MLGNVIFVDRDGVINRDSPDYVKNWGEFEFLPRSLAALKRLTEAGFTAVVITNQSAVNRGITSVENVEEIHARMRVAVTQNGGRIHDVFYCPHAPEENCACRKPRAGLIHAAGRAHDIDIAASVMVGDSERDVRCGRNAGCGAAVLVRTGNGRAAERALAAERRPPDHVAGDLYDAVEWILGRR